MFTSVDPLAPMTMQPYLYGSANPVTHSDPTGLCTFISGRCHFGDGSTYDPDSDVSTPAPRPRSEIDAGGACSPGSPEVCQIFSDLGRTTARSLGFEGLGTVGNAPAAIRSAAFAWLGKYGEPSAAWDALLVADIPLAFIVAYSDLGDLDAEEIMRILSSVPAPVQEHLADLEHTYDRWCGCGNWVNRPDPLRPYVAFLGLPRDELGIATNVGVTAATARLPFIPSTGFSIGVALLAEAYLGAEWDIDPNVKVHADRNYWTTLSGLPQWPPFHG